MARIEPGDMVVVVYASDPFPDFIGQFRTALAYEMTDKGMQWRLDKPVEGVVPFTFRAMPSGRLFEKGDTVACDHLPEHWLQPIKGMPRQADGVTTERDFAHA